MGHRLRDDHGFTLVELLVTMSLLSVVMGLITGSAIFLQRSINETDQRFDDLAQARLAMDASTKWARSAVTVVPYSQPFLEARSNRVEFLANVDVGGVNAAPKQVRLQVSGGRFEERVFDGQLVSGGWTQSGSARTRVIARGVTNGNTLFRYFDANGVELTNGTNNLSESVRRRIRSVGIDITVQQAPGVNVPPSRLTNRVLLPNQFYFDAEGTP